jgi:hypothetical protein
MLSGQCSSRKTSRERYYVCRNIAEHRYYPYNRAAKVEAAFIALLRNIVADPGLLEPEDRHSDVDALKAKSRALKERLADIEERRRKVWERADALTGPQLRERLDEIDAERERLRTEANQNEREIRAAAKVTASTVAVSETLTMLADDWPEAPLELQGEVARAVAAAVGGIFVLATLRRPRGCEGEVKPTRSCLLALRSNMPRSGT